MDTQSIDHNYESTTKTAFVIKINNNLYYRQSSSQPNQFTLIDDISMATIFHKKSEVSSVIRFIKARSLQPGVILTVKSVQIRFTIETI
ncbi:MAG: hypothetical protein ACRCXZ_04340 [Patescibacteria group bacterium]